MKLELEDLVVASFDTGGVSAYDTTEPTVDTVGATVTICNRCPPDTAHCA
jgi:hypothetical protein